MQVKKNVDKIIDYIHLTNDFLLSFLWEREQKREGENNLGKKEVNIFNEMYSKVQDIKCLSI